MSKPSLVYVLYIQSTPEKVWDAITDPEQTKEYWVRHRNASDWKAGSRWEHQDYDDPSLVDLVGHVLESDHPRRLVISWASPEQPEQLSKVSFDIEPFHGTVRLTVTHEDLEPGSPMHEGVSGGWPMVLSAMKSWLETGSAPEFMRRRWDRTPD